MYNARSIVHILKKNIYLVFVHPNMFLVFLHHGKYLYMKVDGSLDIA